MTTCTQEFSRTRRTWIVSAVVLGAVVCLPAAEAAERQFLVILANAPKQFPGPREDEEELGKPVGGLINRQLIHDQYFDRIRPDIGSFAEYWEEISYGDVRISGDTTDWINLPWAIMPPLVNEQSAPPVDDAIDNPAFRNSPANFFDLNFTGFYEYGESERFDNFRAAVAIDLDGDPGGDDNGPYVPGPGGGHYTRPVTWFIPPFGFFTLAFPVYKPGERFVDMDGDGRWDGLDEVNNVMDWDGDGKPDLVGPWVDLDEDGEAANGADCLYLSDADNDKNPDCCPDGPGKASCKRFDPNNAEDKSCPPTRWAGRNGDIIDCNGNLVPDACDISCTSQECVASGFNICGGSKDRLPFEADGEECVPGDGDQIPDECQYQNHNEECVATLGSPDDPCGGNHPLCLELGPARETTVRCEYVEFDDDDTCNAVEPFENFLRRWDPVLHDPYAHPANYTEDRSHWIRAYDTTGLAGEGACGTQQRKDLYAAARYIKDNYPGQGRRCVKSGALCLDDTGCTVVSGDACGKSGTLQLIEETHGRPLYQQHDPNEKLGPRDACRCRDGSECKTVALPNGENMEKACVVGIHVEYNPPDSWLDQTANNAPRNAAVRTTQMQAPSVDHGEGLLVKLTPEPGDLPEGYVDKPWYEAAWSDRYNAGICRVPLVDGVCPTGQSYNASDCQNPNFDQDCPANAGNPERATTCTPPTWRTTVPRMISFPDPVVEGYTPELNRRYFHANSGGTNGDGTGWFSCGSAPPGAVRFETGPVGPVGFEENCNAAILPEERDGASEPAIFFDGYVEHDDLASSKYHRSGDERLGEVTSPFSNDIWGEDRGPGYSSGSPVDSFIAPGGPYAVSVHGNNGRDAGNVLSMELLTWRTAPPFNNGFAWENEGQAPRSNPYAGYPTYFGFRDYNLDGLVDQGEVRHAGSDNYMSDPVRGTPNNGIDSVYPWHRDRIVEDCIAVIDDLVDFDDYVDAVSMNAYTCGRGGVSAEKPSQFDPIDPVTPDPSVRNVQAFGILSGIILLPDGSHKEGFFNRAPNFIPIHNEDGLGDPLYTAATFPKASPKLSWNIFFHNLVTGLGVSAEGDGTVPFSDFQTAFSAHEWLHTWQRFPDLYDYDVYAPLPRPLINCPVGSWDIMSGGGLVHSAPILKESTCTQWIRPVDLATVLTPGVDTTITLPRSEFVRDDSYFFLENENREGERYYFWSVGTGFDERMPGEGMLVMHTDVGSNPDALPSGQANGTRFFYHIVQADGQSQLDDCTNRGDAGDPWPGQGNRRRFNYQTVPQATWYTLNSWTGLDILDVVPDGSGSVQLKLNWVPTALPSLKFINPPGGESVRVGPGNIRYKINFDASDVFGGTTIRLHYTDDPADVSAYGANKIGELRKSTAGINHLSLDWNIFGLADGRYHVFAELVPGQGADGVEQAFTAPRAGRTNGGDGALTVDLVDIPGHKARLETFRAECAKLDGSEWKITGTISQPAPSPTDANQDPYPHAKTCPRTTADCSSFQYTSVGGGVKFTIKAGTIPFSKGDTFTFTTTGITAPSVGVTIVGGQVKLEPTARIVAGPLSGDPPLTVSFDGRSSVDPNGEPLQFIWNFGDGSPTATGGTASHTFIRAGRFTTTLRATNTRNGRFGEASVDIDVTNNSPRAAIAASPISGQAPLTVRFNGSQSSDVETPADQLVYRWDFGDGSTANDAGVAGAFISTEHFYSRRADGTECTRQAPCNFNATLTVTDSGGKSSSATITIVVGNTNPIASVTADPVQGTPPLQVTFNASGSTDADGDTLKVDWIWGDGEQTLNLPLTGESGATDGSVRHTYRTQGAYTPSAIVKDGRGGEGRWSGLTITVNQAATGASDPRAIFSITPTEPKLNQEFTVDASLSFDTPAGGRITSYTWDWGDTTAFGAGVIAKHTYTKPGSYRITLTVADAETPANTARAQKTAIITGGGTGGGGQGNRPPTATFGFTPSQPLVGETVDFDASRSADADNDALEYKWTFGDGDETSFSVAVTATHEFAASGTFLVRLAVRDEHGMTTEVTQAVRVLSPSDNRDPIAIIAGGPRNGVVGSPITFDGRLSYDPDGDNVGFTWTISQNGTVLDTRNGPVVTQVFRQVGNYTVLLEVRDDAGAVGTDGPVAVSIAETSVEPPEGRPPPDTGGLEDPGDSSSQRPTPIRVCGVGMLLPMLLMLLGLTALSIHRRTRP
ncbi:MAG: PKD domain-containing protein [Planctomycetota bacterium]